MAHPETCTFPQSAKQRQSPLVLVASLEAKAYRASIVPSCVALASYTPQVNNFSRLKDGLYDFQPVHLHSHTVMRPWPRLCSDIAAIRCQKHKQARQLSHFQGVWRCSTAAQLTYQPTTSNTPESVSCQGRHTDLRYWLRCRATWYLSLARAARHLINHIAFKKGCTDSDRWLHATLAG